MLLLWSLSIIGYEAQTQKENLTIGYITSMDGPPLVQAEGRSISGAMSLAVNVINENPSILPNHTLRFIFSDNHADPLASVHVLTEQWRAQAIAFIGPEGYCETEARVAASWNLPMVSYKCSDPVVSDKSRFPTFARTQPSSSLSGSSVVRLMLYYGWRKFSIVVELNDLMIEQDRSSRSWPNIYVLFTCTKAFQDMVNFLQEMGLTDTGEYVVIGIRDDETYDETKASSLVIPGTRLLLRLLSKLLCLKTWCLKTIFCFNKQNYTPLLQISIFGAYLYDAVQVYARALHEVLISGGDIRNGTDIFNRIKDRTFQGIQGHEVYIDENGDAEANFTVLALRPDTGIYGYAMRPIGRFLRDTLDRHNLTFIEDVKVYGEFIPLDEPECGMKGRNAGERVNCEGRGARMSQSVFTIAIKHKKVFFDYELLFFRNWRYEQELASLIWKIDPKEIQKKPETAYSAISIMSNNGPHNTLTMNSEVIQEQRFTEIGVYRGSLVALKPIHTRHHIDVTRDMRLELKQLRDIRHDNIVHFIGATVEHNCLQIVTDYCSKGSLEDILENADLKLDHMFTASIVSDILKGMMYIHSSPIVCHGELKSSNCLVDSRWVVKISDLGLKRFKARKMIPDIGIHAKYKRLLWTAPEILRKNIPLPLGGTQRGDVYSFGILLYEIMCRKGPYGDCHLSPREIISRVTRGPVDGIAFRPNTSQLTSCDTYILDTMRACWDENPDLRRTSRPVEDF
ncbi:hypothetical protein C0Q70_01035 [Pomacea canaliculata]|uniref:guanylate cyclase n=1 Tax=Pomacea canaliculata TaxID=400727 RepID=A0A2T7PYE3_POMCA|nr:hypothetical protein C0Q70_01035 [Pomacea canaliculata]